MSDEEPIKICATRKPGVCFACRHANQDTEDFELELVFCKFQSGKREWKSPCDMTLELEPDDTVYLYEPFNGKNCTWALPDAELDVRIDDEPPPRER